MKILAIDPGYERLGVAVLEKLPKQRERVIFSTCIRTDKSEPHQDRLTTIANEVRGIIATWEPEALAIESLFLATNQKTAMKVAEVRGAILVEAARAAIAVYEYTPLQVKIAVTGYGKSDKKQMTKMVKKLVALPPEKSLPPQTAYSLYKRENKSLPAADGGTPFSKGRIRLDDEYDAIAVGLTCLTSTNNQQHTTDNKR